MHRVDQAVAQFFKPVGEPETHALGPPGALSLAARMPDVAPLRYGDASGHALAVNDRNLVPRNIRGPGLTIICLSDLERDLSVRVD